jgi:hypothetical protein
VESGSYPTNLTIRANLQLSRQALAAFSAASCKNAATSYRSHTAAETMAAFANELAWLIRAFHGSTPKLNSKLSKRTRCISVCPAIVNGLITIMLKKSCFIQMTNKKLEFDNSLMLLCAAQRECCDAMLVATLWYFQVDVFNFQSTQHNSLV